MKMASPSSTTSSSSGSPKPPSPVSTPSPPSGADSSSTTPSPIAVVVTGTNPARLRIIERLVFDLSDPHRRESALYILARQVGCKELALMLWYSFGTMTVLVGEVLSIYPFLSPPTLTLAQSNRACNALALLQCVACNPNTKSLLLRALIPVYLIHFIKATCYTKPFEHLRLNSLGVIGALVKVPDSEVVLFLLSREFFPACLGAMETGSELAKSVATFIMQRIMLDDMGLEYVCSTHDRLYALNKALRSVVTGLLRHPPHPSTRLTKLVVRCYLRLSQHIRGSWVLRYALPASLIDGTFHHFLWNDNRTKSALQELIGNVYSPSTASMYCYQYIDDDALHCTILRFAED